MRIALLTTKYYLKRSFSRPIEIALMTLLPVAIIAINVIMNIHIMDMYGSEDMYNGYSVSATIITMMIMLMFQFMSGVYTGEFIYEDFRCNNRWRLHAAPVSASSYVVGALTASIIFSLASAAFVLVVCFLAFNVYLGNIGIIIVVTFLAALISQFMGIIIAYFVKTKRSIDGIIIVLSFAMSAMVGGFMINLPMPAFVQDYIVPTGAALRAVYASGIEPVAQFWRYEPLGMDDALISIAVLVGMAVIFGYAALLIARRRKA